MNDPDQQQALADAIKAHPELLFKAAEQAVGKRRQSVELNQSQEWVIALPPGDDVAE